MLMYASVDPHSGLPYADWFIRFAGNRLATGVYCRADYMRTNLTSKTGQKFSVGGCKIWLADARFDAGRLSCFDERFALQGKFAGSNTRGLKPCLQSIYYPALDLPG